MFCFHSYSKWSKARDQDVSRDTSTKKQIAVCSKCGAIKLRSILWSDYTNARTINEALEEMNGSTKI